MSDLTKFLLNYKEEEEGKKAETERVKEEWVTAVDEFQNQIIAWLQEPISLGLVAIDQPKTKINEGRFGKYDVPELILDFSPSGVKVEFKPIARIIVGAVGRIDIISNKGRYKVIRQKEDEKWYIIEPDETGAEPFKLTPLNEDSLGRILTKLIK